MYRINQMKYHIMIIIGRHIYRHRYRLEYWLLLTFSILIFSTSFAHSQNSPISFLIRIPCRQQFN